MLLDEALKDFRETVEAAAVRLLSMTDERSARRGATGAWSPKEIIGHLIDSASNNHQRFVRAQFTDDLVFPGYEQEAWVRVQDYGQASWPLLVELWKTYNLHLAHVMSRVPEESRRRPRAVHNLDRIAWRSVGADTPATLEYFMLDYIGHLKNHLRQIFDRDGDG